MIINSFNLSVEKQKDFVHPTNQRKINKLNFWMHQHPIITKILRIAVMTFGLSTIILPISFQTIGFFAVLLAIVGMKLALISLIAYRTLDTSIHLIPLGKDLKQENEHPKEMQTSEKLLLAEGSEFKPFKLSYHARSDQKNHNVPTKKSILLPKDIDVEDDITHNVYIDNSEEKIDQKLPSGKYIIQDIPKSCGLLKTQSMIIEEEKKIEPGKHFTYLFKDGETVYGKESVTRRDSIADLKINLTKQLQILNENIIEKQKLLAIDPSQIQLQKEIQDIKKELNFCEKSLENANQTSIVFIKTNYYREILKQIVEKQQNYYREELKKIVEERQNYSGLIDKICVEAPINFRYQKCITKENQKEIGFFRLGAITNPRNGFTHLGELIELAKNSSNLEVKIKKLSKEFDKLKKNTLKIIQKSLLMNMLWRNWITKILKKQLKNDAIFLVVK